MDSMFASQDLVPPPSEEEILAQYTKRLAQWGEDWAYFFTKLGADPDMAITMCTGNRPLHPDSTLGEEAETWQQYADLNGVDGAIEAFGPKPTPEHYPDALLHDARALEHRKMVMRQQTTKNQTPKIGGVPGTLRDDLIAPPTGPDPKPIPYRPTFTGYASPVTAQVAPTMAEPASPPNYEQLDFGNEEEPAPATPAPFVLPDLTKVSVTAAVQAIAGPRSGFTGIPKDVPRADDDDTLTGIRRAAITMEAQDAAPEENDVLDIQVAEQAIEYASTDLGVESPRPAEFEPASEPEEPPSVAEMNQLVTRATLAAESSDTSEDLLVHPARRQRQYLSPELRLLLATAVIGFSAFLLSQVIAREPARHQQAPAVCLLPEALDRLSPTKQLAYIDCQLPHEARPSFHCRAPRPNTERAQIELCTRAWRACAPPFGTAISPEAQAYCLAHIVPPPPLRP